GWRFGELFLYENQLSPQTILLLGRLPVMLLSLLLGLIIFKVTRSMFGGLTAFTALCLFSFDPNIITHSRYVTTDLAFTLMSFVTLLSFNRVLQKPTKINAGWLALSFTVAGLTKFSGFAFLAVMIVLTILMKIHSPDHS